MRWRKKKKKEEEDSRKWRTWSVKNRGQFRDNQVFPRFLRGSASKRAVLERRRSTTSHPPRFSLTFYFENGTETSFPIPLPLTRRPPTSSTLSPLLRPPDTETPLKKIRGEERRGEESRGNKRARSKRATGAHWTELIIFMTLHDDDDDDDEMAVQKMRCLSLPRYLGGKRRRRRRRSPLPGDPFDAVDSCYHPVTGIPSASVSRAAFYSSPFLRYYTFVAAWWINGHRPGDGSVIGRGAVTLLGIKGDPTGFGRNSADLGYWETRQAGGNRGRFYYRLFFFFLEKLDQKFRPSFSRKGRRRDRIERILLRV